MTGQWLDNQKCLINNNNNNNNNNNTKNNTNNNNNNNNNRCKMISLCNSYLFNISPDILLIYLKGKEKK